MAGGAGADAFVIGAAVGNNIIQDRKNGAGLLDFRAVGTIHSVDQFLSHTRQVGGDVIEPMEDGNRPALRDAALDMFDTGDFIFDVGLMQSPVGQHHRKASSRAPFS